MSIINIRFNVELANQTYYLMCRQELYGVKFNAVAALELVETIDKRMAAIEMQVEPQLPERPLNKGEEAQRTPPKVQFKKDGTPSAACLKWFDKVAETPSGYAGIKVVDGEGVVCSLPYNKPLIKSLPMQLKHQEHLKNWFMSLGWKPSLWNYKKGKDNKPMRDTNGKQIKTSPKFHDKGRICPNLERIGDKVNLAKPVIEWLSLRNRRSVLLNESKGTGWLSNPRLKRDGRLSASSSGLTNTHRQKHAVVANVPRVGSLLGSEFRGLYVASDGLVMVGADASGLEARIKGHYTHKYDNGAYAEKLLDPEYDEHSENAALWDCEREEAKSPGYALQYNCQPPKFASTLGVPLEKGKEYYDAYWTHNWALRKAIEETEEEYEQNGRKYIRSIDGSKILTRAKHSVFNAKCQSTGAKIMDLAGVLAQMEISKRKIPAERVIYYHDELQFETFKKYAEEVGQILTDSMAKAGEIFKLNVPITGAYKIGKSWADTH